MRYEGIPGLTVTAPVASVIPPPASAVIVPDVGAVVGSIIIGMVNNGLILFGFSVDQQVIFRGVIILIAVALSPKGPKE